MINMSMLYSFINDDLIILTLKILILKLILVLVIGFNFLKFSFVVVVLTVDVGILEVTTNNQNQCGGEESSEFFELIESFLSFMAVTFALTEFLDPSVVNLREFLVQLIEVLADKTLGKLDGFLFRKAHVLDRNVLFPDQVGQKDNFFERVLVYFSDYVLKKLSKLVLPPEVNDKTILLNLGKEGSVFIDDFGDTFQVVMIVLQIEEFPLESLGLEVAQNILLVFHVFLELFEEGLLVLIHEGIFETYVKRV